MAEIVNVLLLAIVSSLFPAIYGLTRGEIAQINKIKPAVIVNIDKLVTSSDLISWCDAVSPYRFFPPVVKMGMQVMPSFVIDRIIQVADVAQTVSVRGTLALGWVATACEFNATAIGLDFERSYMMSTPNSDEYWHPQVVFQSGIDDVGMQNNFHNYLILVVEPWTTQSGAWTRNITFNLRKTGVFETEVKLDMATFPFDKQNVTFKFCLQGNMSSLAFSDQLDFSVPDGERDTKSQWWTSPKEASSSLSFVETAVGPGMPHISVSCMSFNTVLHRRPDFFIYSIIFPCFLLVLLNIPAFLMPPSIADRVAFNVGILMAVSVFISVVVQQIPATPQRVFLSDLTSLFVIFSALCTLQSSVIFWFTQTFAKVAARKAFSRVTVGRVLDVVSFLVVTAFLIYACIYAILVATASGYKFI